VSTSRATYHHGDLRATLLATVDEVLAEHGPDGLSLREVSRRAGVSHAAAYKHFADKAELLGVYVDAAFGAFEKTLEAARTRARSPREALIAIGVAYVRFAWKRPAAFRLMFRPEFSGARIGDHHSAVTRTHDVLVETVAAAQAAGALKPGPLDIQVLAAWSMVHGLAKIILDGPDTNRVANASAAGTLARAVIETMLRENSGPSERR
jgi:AcrR family transcriptional regulator